MSREEAMSAYITEMKLVAQKVIDTVPLGEVAEDMFGYFEPLYQVIPDMPRPPETFLRRVTGWQEPAVNRDVQAAPEPSHPPKEPAPPSPESRLPRDLDLEVFCDSVEQLEPELVRVPVLSPVPAESELPHLHTGTGDSAQRVWAEQKEAAGRELTTRSSPESPGEKKGFGGSLMGPQELDRWLVGTVQAMQESMKDVHRRLQILESKPQPLEQGKVRGIGSGEAKSTPGGHFLWQKPGFGASPSSSPRAFDRVSGSVLGRG
nr:acyl-CoA-binding domain-containing protein 4 isoform X10 [Rattus norvegicus]XP_038942046.1 acyl-CoA-binding domain-containing protein 4 isoform X10 [Rattus norvegicus]